ncbi:MAG: FtsX-like permease family protein, partial [Clostridia bacterium]|nr:FtsX-like permease family protein [Clostridia bacterium]
KEGISEHIKDYNNRVEEANQITYTDYIGLMMSSVTTIIEAIGIILMAFVAISLVVSSIMIGIITYISVLERTKEIGILRAMGASKRDISRVFNAETLIVGFTSGAFGIAVTLLLVMIANAIIYPLTDIPSAAVLPVGGAVILVIISMVLTFIAGLIPSRVAANKDPVEALRSE